MHPENVWRWLDAIDQDHLDPLDQWGLPPSPRRSQDKSPRFKHVFDGTGGEIHQQYKEKHNADLASLQESIPPAGILLRNGSIRLTGQSPGALGYDAENDNHPQSLVPGLPACLTHTVEKEDRFQSLVPANSTSSEATGQRTNAPRTRQLQTSGRERNSDSTNPKRLPTSAERARVRDFSGVPHSISVTHVEAKDPIAINCQGARVVGAYQQDGLPSPPSMAEKSRRSTSAGEGALHRRNATKRPSKVNAGPNSHPRY